MREGIEKKEKTKKLLVGTHDNSRQRWCPMKNGRPETIGPTFLAVSPLSLSAISNYIYIYIHNIKQEYKYYKQTKNIGLIIFTFVGGGSA